MHPSRPPAAVGIDLGSSTTTVMVCRGEERPRAQRVDPGSDELPTAPAALVMPASWDEPRRRARAAEADRAGFGHAEPIAEPEAAARYYTGVVGREPAPGTPLVVYSLGASSCNVSVVTAEDDRFTVLAADHLDDVGGRRFDELLGAYLAGRHRPDHPEFASRIDGTGDPADRAELLDRIRAAREKLSDWATVTVDAGFGPELTRTEFEQVVADPVAATIALVERTMDRAGLTPDDPVKLMVVGGAARTPILASRLRERFNADLFIPAMPELAVSEGAALAALAGAAKSGTSGPVGDPRPHSMLPFGVLVVALALLFAIAAPIGVGLVRGDMAFTEVVGDSAIDLPELGGLPESESASESEAEPDRQDPPAPESSDAPGTPTTGEPPSIESETEPGAEPSESESEPPSDEPSTSPSSPPASESPDATGVIPDVTGESVSDAKRILAEEGFTEVVVHGRRRTHEGPRYDDCEVSSQGPAGGTERGYDDRITLTYTYVGTDTC
ncbi:Hsp70 family protein [Glycomyces xiaoerkulensis]|uniref:Hsp70 family protein n=1 Tax=Glycomyces xiaoerkulensis TaxID=2038139 RepID=UPI000C269A62|nr:Hsp70 family protein [Glycomyces xiaoerkulensis]